MSADKPEGRVAGEAIIQAVENQIRDNDPPETKRTLERLMKNGESRANALRYIGSALTVEIFDALKNQKPYNHERYLRNLEALPKMPWSDDDEI